MTRVWRGSAALPHRRPPEEGRPGLPQQLWSSRQSEGRLLHELRKAARSVGRISHCLRGNRLPARNRAGATLDRPDLRFLTAPFVAQLAQRPRAVFAPHPATGPRERQERLLPSSGTVFSDGYQRRDGAPMPCNDRGPAFFSGFKKIRKLIACFLRTLTK